LEVTTFCCCIFDWYHSADQIIKEQKERLNYQDEKLDRQEQKLDQQAQLLQQQAKLIEALTKTSDKMAGEVAELKSLVQYSLK